jgi:hypothetical protein
MNKKFYLLQTTLCKTQQPYELYWFSFGTHLFHANFFSFFQISEERENEMMISELK